MQTAKEKLKKSYIYFKKLIFPPSKQLKIFETCPMCKYKVETPFSTLCGHTYCFPCISKWCKDFNCCPTCKTIIHQNEFIPCLPKETQIDYKHKKFMYDEDYQMLLEEYLNFKKEFELNVEKNLLENEE
ncbi:ubiquitin- ligase E3 [Tubulinosema ratisbonensis]|uniref:Ubiquitin-ligase E3 n=1 Tax=Tubulinosema ratisbonensis TaxID=291195 RepID=A0A437ANN6_9MICR|nr:ubiquitin- ligase E3 [Tubulinosema ratisbonensis]